MASLGLQSQRQSAEQGSQQTSSALSQSLAQSQQQAAAAQQTFVDPGQQGFLDFLRQQGQGVAQTQLQPGFGAGAVAQQQAGQLGGIGQDLLGRLQGGAQGQGGLAGQLAGAVGGVVQGGAAGTEFLQQRLREGNPFLNEQISQLGQDIGTEFRESILPGIRRGATQIGALGGGRQGVAEGLAAQGAQRSFAQQAANLRFSDLGVRQAAAGQLQQAALQGGQLAGAGIGQQLAASQAGIGALPGLFNLGQSPFGAAFGPLQEFAGLLGGPTVLSTGTSESRGSSLSQALSQAESQGTSFGQSRGSGSGINASFGTLFTG